MKYHKNKLESNPISRAFDRRPVLSLSVIVLSVVIGGYAGYSYLLSHRLQEKLEDKPWPTTKKELHNWYHSVPHEKNAAPVYEKAFSALKTEHPEKLDSVASYRSDAPAQPPRPLPGALRRAMKRYLDRNAKALRLLRKAANLPKSRYPIDFTSPSVRLPHLSPIRELWRLCRIDALYKASIGKSRAALDAVRTAIGLAQSQRKEPVLMCQRHRSSGLFNAADTILELSQRLDLSVRQLKTLQDMWREVEMAPGWKWASIGEFVLRVDSSVLYMMPGHHDPPLESIPTDKLLYFVYKISGVSDMDRIRAVELCESFIPLYELRPEERFGETQKLKPSSIDASPVMVRTNSCLHQFREAAITSILLQAVKRLMLTTLHVELYRKQHGQLPDDLSQLSAPEKILTDPYTGSMLKYRQHAKGTGYTLYSVGADTKTDRAGKIEKSITFSTGRGRYKHKQDIVVNIQHAPAKQKR